jgi:hypothetical protein
MPPLVSASHAGGMMRRPKRPSRGQRAVTDFAGDRSDHRDFQQLRRRKHRQDRRQPHRQHRIPGVGRTDHQHEIIPMPTNRWLLGIERDDREAEYRAMGTHGQRAACLGDGPGG